MIAVSVAGAAESRNRLGRECGNVTFATQVCLWQCYRERQDTNNHGLQHQSQRSTSQLLLLPLRYCHEYTFSDIPTNIFCSEVRWEIHREPQSQQCPEADRGKIYKISFLASWDAIEPGLVTEWVSDSKNRVDWCDPGERRYLLRTGNIQFRKRARTSSILN